MKLIYYWSPFLTNVATTSAVIHSAISLKKYSNKYDPVIIDACGEFENHRDFILKNKIRIIKLYSFNYFKYLPKNGYLISRISFIIIFLLSFFPLYRILKKNEPDFFICHLITSLPILIANIFSFNTKFILRISGLPKLNFFRKTYWKFSNRSLFKITTPTVSTYEHLKALNLFDEHKIKVLRDPVIDIKKINSCKSEEIEDFLKNGDFILSVGRLTKQKNFQFLLNCFSELSNKYQNLKLVILGEGEEKNILKNMIIKKNLKEKVFLLGFKENIFKYLSRAKFFVLSSLWEDPGWVLLEAAACNTLILSSNCKNGPSEILENNLGGVLYQVSNKNNFIESFELLNKLNSKEIYEKKLFVKKKSHLFTKFKHFKILEKIILN